MTKRLEPDPDLDALVHQLNSSAQRDSAAANNPIAGEEQAVHAERPGRWRLPAAQSEGREWLQHLLNQARSLGASDLMLVTGTRATARVNGSLHPFEGPPLTASATELLCAALTPDTRRPQFHERGALDFAVTWPGTGRLRCNVHRERDRWAAAIRLLPSDVPTLESLLLPPTLDHFAELEYGLILVTGPTGCGKSTTLAALIRRILSLRRVHLVTVEDPVEYEHPHGESVVEHIELARDAVSYPDAIRSALRQDPDVLLIGEMRDPESISSAITAAETGHLVLSTLHTGDGPQTIHRILDSYPGNQTELVRSQLSVSLAGIVSQQLLPRKDGRGRVAATEIMVATPAVRNLIRQGKIEQLRSQFQLEARSGMLALDLSLARLVQQGLVDAAEARPRARTPDEFEHLLGRKGI